MLLLLSGLARAGPAVDCEAQARAAPEQAETWRCFYLQARREGDWDTARARLRRELTARPDNGHAWLNLGHIAAARGGEDGVGLYREALDRYAGAGDDAGTVQAQVALAIHRNHRADPVEEVLAHLDAAQAAARRTGDPILLATVDAQRARVLWRRVGDLGRADALIRDAEARAFPDGPYQLRLVVLHVMAGICQETGRLDEAYAASVRLVELTAAAGDRYVEATARLNVAHFALTNPDRVPPGTGVRESERALAAAEAVGNPFIVAGAVCIRAGILLQSGAPSLPVWERCAEAHDALGEPLMASIGHLGIAAVLAESEPRAALSWAERVVAAAQAANDAPLEVLGRLAVAGLRWTVDGPDAGRAAFAAHHAVAERLLDQQTDAESRAGVLSNLTDGHHLSAWRLVGLGESGVDEALAELEQLRARELADALRDAELLPPEDPELTEALAAVAVQISRLNITLGQSQDPSERAALNRRHRALEYEEAVLRDRRRSRHGVVDREPPSLAQVQAALRPGEVLLSFQTPPPLVQLPTLETRPWVLAIDHASVGVARLPPRRDLETLVPTFAGLYAEAGAGVDPTAARAAAATWAKLLGPALEALGRDPLEAPARLILVPDGPLHGLPFAALRPRADGLPLGVSSALSRVPSVASWLALRAVPAAPSSTGLALGDPLWPTAAGVPLSPLPAAGREALRVGRALDLEVRVGADAREAVLKSLSQPPRLLHIAAHGRDPGATAGSHALILASGEGEDGVLEAREVRDLALQGTVVVLSACRGASGRVREGDGLDGLSRAFLLAGAPVVVGSLWPVPDDAAARFFERFADALATGASVDAALQQVRAGMAAQGVPDAAWAGMVAIGDGARTLPRVARTWEVVRGEWGGLWGLGLVGLGLSLGGAGWVAVRRRRRGAAPPEAGVR